MTKYLVTLLFLAQSLLYGYHEQELETCEHSLYSANGEDGVLSKIFQLLSLDSKYCVDIGAGDGITRNKTYLLRLQGWDGLLLDRAYEISEYNLHKEFVTAENINSIFNKYEVPPQFNLLSIHVRYNDYYLWKALDDKYSPAVVVIGYNPVLGPYDESVVKYHPFYCGDATNYFGASIKAYANLGKSKGYSLVYAGMNGCNLFFIRDDILQKKNLVFENMNNVEKLYRSLNSSFKPDPKKRLYITSEDPIKK